MHLQQTIITLAERGWSQRRIARELNVDRETVKRYAPAKPASNPTAGSGESKPASEGNPTAGFSPGPPSQCEPHRAFIEAALERGLSAQRLYQDRRAEHGFHGSYEAVKRFVRRASAARRP